MKSADQLLHELVFAYERGTTGEFHQALDAARRHLRVQAARASARPEALVEGEELTLDEAREA